MVLAIIGGQDLQSAGTLNTRSGIALKSKRMKLAAATGSRYLLTTRTFG
jgi:hypothetical protein